MPSKSGISTSEARVGETAGTPAVILLSGGLDSATTLAVARDAGYACHALSFDYGQRHRFELEAARRVVAETPHARILICGSLYLAGHILREHG